MSNLEYLEILSAGFSTFLGTNVVPVKDGGGFSIDDLFGQTYVTESSLPLEEFDVFVSDGSTVFSFRVKGAHSIRYLKPKIAGKYGTTANSIKLFCRGQELQGSQTVEHYGIQPYDTIHLLKLTRAGESFSYGFNINDLDPPYDYDFTEVTDDGKRYERGGFEYKRPYGWKRIAIKVRGKYSDDVWLGRDGIRQKQSRGEWPVSYHGTNWGSANKIVKTGYKAGPRDKFGKGIYSSPSLEMVEKKYAKEFLYKGEKYKIVLQNRVNPDQSNGRLKIIPASETGVGADYWLSAEHSDVRPYGILILHLKTEEPSQGYCPIF